MTDEQFDELVHQYQRLILSVCHRYVQDFGEAENLTQDTFLSAYKNRESFQGDAYKAWLVKIATNKCLDFLRSPRHKRLEYHPDEELSGYLDEGQPDVQQLVDSEDTVRRVAELCDELKEPYASVARMYYIDQWDFGRIAQDRQVPIKTIQTQVYRARNQLRKQLREVLAR